MLEMIWARHHYIWLLHFILKVCHRFGDKPTRFSWYKQNIFHILIGIENNCGKDVVERILTAGADLNARTEWGDTPAHYAAAYSCYDVLRQLIDKGCEVHKPIECKYT